MHRAVLDRVPDCPTGGLSLDEVRAAVEAVCRSSCFARSDRLQRLLRYVCEATLRGEGAAIKESVLAVEVFGCSPEYDPHKDSMVRRQAHALRQKLKEYYETEGRADKVQIELPVGRYVPVFRRQDGHLGSERRGARSPARAWWPAALALPAFLAGLAVSPWLSNSTSGLEKAQVEIWRPWLENPNGPVVCLTNRPTALVKHFEDPQPAQFALVEELASPSEERRMRAFFKLPDSGKVYLTPSLAQMKVGEAIGAVHIANLLGRAGVPLRIVEGRFMSWEVLRQENVIFLGELEANPWIAALLEGHPVGLEPVSRLGPRRIVVRNPRADEPSQYSGQEKARGEGISYALIAFVPGLERGRQALVIAGLTSRATQSAAEFITSPLSLRALLARLRQAAPRHRGPWRFQVVLETRLRDKVPSQAWVRLIRVL